MIGRLIIPVTQHVLMNDDDLVHIAMSTGTSEDPQDCSESWAGEQHMRREVMSLSWEMGFELSIVPARAR